MPASTKTLKTWYPCTPKETYAPTTLVGWRPHVCKRARTLLYCSVVYHRVLVVGIIVFWVWMMALLFQTEWLPGAPGQQSPVPTAYIWKLMFLHQEPSDLVLFSRGQRLGSFHLQPHREEQTSPGESGPFRSVKALGGFNFDSPWAARQNVVLHGLLELDSHDDVQRLELSAAFHTPKQPTPGWSFALDGQPPTGQWHYSIRQGDDLIREKSGTLAELLDLPELRSLGVDPASLGRMQQQLAHATIIAHRDKLRMNGDEIDAYVVSVKDASGLETTLHMNQLGQILALKTPLGFELLDGALTP